MKILMETVYGSRLYGLNTENSDWDYKGVYMPDLRDVILGKVQKSITKSTGNNHSKNTSDDIDSEYYSLHHFIKLACKGETVAIDMLFAPPSMLLESSSIWCDIVWNREKFLSKNMSAFMGYAKHQAIRYSRKADKYDSIRTVINLVASFINEKYDVSKLSSVWDLLPVLPPWVEKKEKTYIICGSKFTENVSIQYLYDNLILMANKYGKRVKEAADKQSVDWKSLSHAVRVIYELECLVKDHCITFPIPNPMASTLKGIKCGQFSIDYISDFLEVYMAEVSDLIENSSLPEKVDEDYWKSFIINTYLKIYNIDKKRLDI